MKQPTKLDKTLSLVLAVSFLLTSSNPGTAHAQPLTSANADRISLPAALPADLNAIRVPAESGNIREVYRAAGPLSPDPVVILIQDAHAIPQAQQSIQSLIQHFSEKYGANLVALEGASTHFDTSILKSFPDQKKLKEIMNSYHDRGELTGASSAALLGSGENVTYTGIEDWKLYEQGILLYQQALGQEKLLLDQLQATSHKLQAEKEKSYSKELLKVDQLIRDFQSGEKNIIEVIQGLEKAAGSKSVSVPVSIKTLMEETKNDFQVSAAVDREIRGIADKVRIAMSRKPQLISENTTGENELLTADRLLLNAEFNAKYQSYLTQQISTGEFGAYLKGLIERGDGGWGLGDSNDSSNPQHLISIPLFSTRLTALIGHYDRLQNLEGTQLFNDFETYSQSVKESLFRSEEERRLDRETRELYLQGKLAKLELTWSEWHEIKKLIGETSFVKSEEIESPIAFYQNAEARDFAFLSNLTRLMDVNASRTTLHTSLLVAGGFHTGGLTEQFRKQGISYILVTPSFNSLPEQNTYRDQMQGNVSWKQYLKVQDGKVNPRQGFLRAVRDQLVSETLDVKGEKSENDSQFTIHNSQILKEWRDQILRDLASREQLDKAGEYTALLDEVVPQSDTAQITKKLTVKIEKWIAGLKSLEASHRLTEQNVIHLLQQTTTLQPLANTVFSSDLLQAGIVYPSVSQTIDHRPRTIDKGLSFEAGSLKPEADLSLRSELRSSDDDKVDLGFSSEKDPDQTGEFSKSPLTDEIKQTLLWDKRIEALTAVYPELYEALMSTVNDYAAAGGPYSVEEYLRFLFAEDHSIALEAEYQNALEHISEILDKEKRVADFPKIKSRNIGGKALEVESLREAVPQLQAIADSNPDTPDGQVARNVLAKLAQEQPSVAAYLELAKKPELKELITTALRSELRSVKNLKKENKPSKTPKKQQETENLLSRRQWLGLAGLGAIAGVVSYVVFQDKQTNRSTDDKENFQKSADSKGRISQKIMNDKDAPWHQFDADLNSSDPEKRLESVKKAIGTTINWLNDKGYPYPDVLNEYGGLVKEKSVEAGHLYKELYLAKSWSTDKSGVKKIEILIDSKSIADDLRWIKNLNSLDFFMVFAITIMREAWGLKGGVLISERLISVSETRKNLAEKGKVFTGKSLGLSNELLVDFLLLNKKDIVRIAALDIGVETYEGYRWVEGVQWAIKKEFYAPSEIENYIHQNIATVPEGILGTSGSIEQDRQRTQGDVDKLIAAQLSFFLTELYTKGHKPHNRLFLYFFLLEMKRFVDSRGREGLDPKVIAWIKEGKYLPLEFLKSSADHLLEDVHAVISEIERKLPESYRSNPRKEQRSELRNGAKVSQRDLSRWYFEIPAEGRRPVIQFYAYDIYGFEDEFNRELSPWGYSAFVRNSQTIEFRHVSNSRFPGETTEAVATSSFNPVVLKDALDRLFDFDPRAGKESVINRSEIRSQSPTDPGLPELFERANGESPSGLEPALPNIFILGGIASLLHDYYSYYTDDSDPRATKRKPPQLRNSQEAKAAIQAAEEDFKNRPAAPARRGSFDRDVNPIHSIYRAKRYLLSMEHPSTPSDNLLRAFTTVLSKELVRESERDEAYRVLSKLADEASKVAIPNAGDVLGEMRAYIAAQDSFHYSSPPKGLLNLQGTVGEVADQILKLRKDIDFYLTDNLKLYVSRQLHAKRGYHIKFYDSVPRLPLADSDDLLFVLNQLQGDIKIALGKNEEPSYSWVWVNLDELRDAVNRIGTPKDASFQVDIQMGNIRESKGNFVHFLSRENKPAADYFQRLISSIMAHRQGRSIYKYDTLSYLSKNVEGGHYIYRNIDSVLQVVDVMPGETALRVTVSFDQSGWKYDKIHKIAFSEPIEGAALINFASRFILRHGYSEDGIEKSVHEAVEVFKAQQASLDLLKDWFEIRESQGVLQQRGSDESLKPVHIEILTGYEKLANNYQFIGEREENGKKIWTYRLYRGADDFYSFEVDGFLNHLENRFPELLDLEFEDGQLVQDWRRLKSEVNHLTYANYSHAWKNGSGIRSRNLDLNIEGSASIKFGRKADIGVVAYYPKNKIDIHRSFIVPKGVTAFDLMKDLEIRLRDRSHGIIDVVSEEELAEKLKAHLDALANDYAGLGSGQSDVSRSETRSNYVIKAEAVLKLQRAIPFNAAVEKFVKAAIEKIGQNDFEAASLDVTEVIQIVTGKQHSLGNDSPYVQRLWEVYADLEKLSESARSDVRANPADDASSHAPLDKKISRRKWFYMLGGVFGIAVTALYIGYPHYEKKYYPQKYWEKKISQEFKSIADAFKKANWYDNGQGGSVVFDVLYGADFHRIRDGRVIFHPKGLQHGSIEDLLQRYGIKAYESKYDGPPVWLHDSSLYLQFLSLLEKHLEINRFFFVGPLFEKTLRPKANLPDLFEFLSKPENITRDHLAELFEETALLTIRQNFINLIKEVKMLKAKGQSMSQEILLEEVAVWEEGYSTEWGKIAPSAPFRSGPLPDFKQSQHAEFIKNFKQLLEQNKITLEPASLSKLFDDYAKKVNSKLTARSEVRVADKDKKLAKEIAEKLIAKDRGFDSSDILLTFMGQDKGLHSQVMREVFSEYGLPLNTADLAVKQRAQDLLPLIMESLDQISRRSELRDIKVMPKELNTVLDYLRAHRQDPNKVDRSRDNELINAFEELNRIMEGLTKWPKADQTTAGTPVSPFINIAKRLKSGTLNKKSFPEHQQWLEQALKETEDYHEQLVRSEVRKDDGVGSRKISNLVKKVVYVIMGSGLLMAGGYVIPNWIENRILNKSKQVAEQNGDAFKREMDAIENERNVYPLILILRDDKKSNDIKNAALDRLIDLSKANVGSRPSVLAVLLTVVERHRDDETNYLAISYSGPQGYSRLSVQALSYLGEIGNKDIIPVLQNILAKTYHPITREAILRAVKKIEDKPAAAVRSGQDTRDPGTPLGPDVRRSELRANLGDLGNIRSLKAENILKLLSELEGAVSGDIRKEIRPVRQAFEDMAIDMDEVAEATQEWLDRHQANISKNAVKKANEVIQAARSEVREEKNPSRRRFLRLGILGATGLGLSFFAWRIFDGLSKKWVESQETNLVAVQFQRILRYKTETNITLAQTAVWDGIHDLYQGPEDEFSTISDDGKIQFTRNLTAARSGSGIDKYLDQFLPGREQLDRPSKFHELAGNGAPYFVLLNALFIRRYYLENTHLRRELSQDPLFRQYPEPEDLLNLLSNSSQVTADFAEEVRMDTLMIQMLADLALAERIERENKEKIAVNWRIPNSQWLHLLDMFSRGHVMGTTSYDGKTTDFYAPGMRLAVRGDEDAVIWVKSLSEEIRRGQLNPETEAGNLEIKSRIRTYLGERGYQLKSESSSRSEVRGDALGGGKKQLSMRFQEMLTNPNKTREDVQTFLGRQTPQMLMRDAEDFRFVLYTLENALESERWWIRAEAADTFARLLGKIEIPSDMQLSLENLLQSVSLADENEEVRTAAEKAVKIFRRSDLRSISQALREKPDVSRSEVRVTEAELELGEKYFKGEVATGPVKSNFRPSRKGDFKFIPELSKEERAHYMRIALQSVANGEGVFSNAAAGAAARMAISQAPDDVKKLAEEVFGQGYELKSKAAVPIGRGANGQVYTFLGLMLANIHRLENQIKEIIPSSKPNRILIMTNPSYQNELDKELQVRNYYGLEASQFVKHEGRNGYQQDLGTVYIANEADTHKLYKGLIAKAQSEEEKQKLQAAYVKALEVSRTAAQELENKNRQAIIYPGEQDPLGHGEFLHQMVSKGVLLDLIESGTRWISFRNIDNSAATFSEDWLVSLGIFLEENLDMQPEVSIRISGQKGGGLIVTEEGNHQLTEDPSFEATFKQFVKDTEAQGWIRQLTSEGNLPEELLANLRDQIQRGETITLEPSRMSFETEQIKTLDELEALIAGKKIAAFKNQQGNIRLNRIVSSLDTYGFNDAVVLFTPGYVMDIYRKDGQSREEFIEEMRQAKAAGTLETIAERGRRKFPALVDPKPGKSAAAKVKIETNMWQSTGIVPETTRVKAVGVRGIANIIKDQFDKASTEERREIVKNLRMLATKSWGDPVESYKSNLLFLEPILWLGLESQLFPKDIFSTEGASISAKSELRAQDKKETGTRLNITNPLTKTEEAPVRPQTGTELKIVRPLSPEYQKQIDVLTAQGGQRSEIRQAAEKVVELALANPVEIADVQVSARTIAKVSVNEFAEVLRAEAKRKIEEIKQRNRDVNVEITPELAEAAVNWLTNVLINKAEGSLGIAFDIPAESRYLEQALAQEGVKSKIGLALISKRMRDLNIKGLNAEMISNLNFYRPRTALENGKALPVLSDDAVSTVGNNFTFRVGLSGQEKQNEPFFAVVAEVARTVSGLLAASKVKNADELRNSATRLKVQAELLKDLFEDFQNFAPGSTIGFDNKGNLIINRNALFNFITEHLAQTAIAKSA